MVAPLSPNLKICQYILVISCILYCISTISSSSDVSSTSGEAEYEKEAEQDNHLNPENMSSFKLNKKENLPQLKIGIVGGGIGGTATAYFLKKMYKKEISLYLYEPEKIGGRLSTSSKFDRKYEVGGAIIHPDNHYMNSFVEELGLKKNFGCQSKAGIFNGKEYAFVESSWSFLNAIKAFLRYGLDLYWLQTYNSNMLKNFARIYEHQRKGISFKSVEALLHSMDPTFPSLVRKSFRAYLKEHKFHDLIIDELVTACTRANYGQSPNIHAFVGSVSVAAANPNLWSVEGGNERVPQELLRRSEAQRFNERVTKISRAADGKFKVWSESSDKDNVVEEVRAFDAVAIAVPLTSDYSDIRFFNFSRPFEFAGRYERIVCTLVQGKVNETTFKYKEVGAQVDEILTDNSALKYNSVGRLSPVNGGGDSCNTSSMRMPIFKVFSPDVLTRKQLSELFENHHRTEITDWLAYPHYESDETLDHFELAPGLYYNNAVEKAASAMEMSAIAAKNIALLISRHLKGQHSQPTPAKDEL